MWNHALGESKSRSVLHAHTIVSAVTKYVMAGSLLLPDRQQVL